jgi:hypothetical protein
MAGLLTGNSPQCIYNAIGNTVGLTEQVALNRAGGFPDNLYSPQEVINISAGRTGTALTYQAALKANLGYSGPGSIQEILLWALAQGKTMAQIIG